MRWWILATLGVVGCDAQFEQFDVDDGNDPPPTAGTFDLGIRDAGAEDFGPNDLGGSDPDLGSSDMGISDTGIVDAGGQQTEVVLGQGDWEDRGYRASGSAELVRLPDGRTVLRTSEDFRAFNLPGPTLLFSDRTRIGRAGIQADDIRIGRLDALSGALEIEVPAEAANRRFAWIYCEPFSADMHAAELVAP
ncbi:MAG: hypothetical protein AAF627_15195 [Myxococcota bacterium]